MKLKVLLSTAALKFALIPTATLAGQLPPTFVASDQGRHIEGAGIPAGSTITAVIGKDKKTAVLAQQTPPLISGAMRLRSSQGYKPTDPSGRVIAATDCPTPPVCNTESYVYPGTIITPTSVAREAAKCIDWRSGSNTADKNQCFGAFQDIISLQDCDAAAFNYLYYNPGCSPKPIKNGLPGF